MTIANLPNFSSFIGSGSTGPFTFAFVFFANSEISVTVQDLNNVVTTLAENIDYTLTGAGLNTGGSVTLTNALTAGYSLTITRTMVIEQGLLLVDGGLFSASAIMLALDYLTMICQQLNKKVDDVKVTADWAAAWIRSITIQPASTTYPYAFSLFMTGDETLPYLNRIMVCSIDPNGADRILTLDAAFPDGSLVLIKNKGANAITVEGQGMGAGQKIFFSLNNGIWE